MIPITYRVVESNRSPVKGALVRVAFNTNVQASATTNTNGLTTAFDGGRWTASVTVKVTAAGFKAFEQTYDLTGRSVDQGPVDLIIARDPGYFAKWVQIQDKATHEPIHGAKMYLDDAPVSASAQDDSKFWLAARCGTHAVKVVKAPDYNTWPGWSFTVANGAQPPEVMYFSKKVTGAKQLTITTAPPKAIVSIYTDTEPRVLKEKIATDKDGVGKTLNNYDPDTLIAFVAVSHLDDAGWTDTEYPFTTRKGTYEYAVMGPVRGAAASSEEGKVEEGQVDDRAGAAKAPLVFKSGVEQAMLEDASPYDYEWLYPNSDDGKYFTTTQARMYIGNLFIDELNTVQFVYQGNRVPVYGYSSEDFDAVGSGRRLVQGQLLINFISEGYLYTVLSEYQRVMAAKSESSPEATGLAKKLTERASLVASAAHTTDRLAFQQTLDGIDREINQLAQAGGPQALDEAKVLVNRTTVTAPRNAIALHIPFDIVLTLEGGGRTVTRTLKDCVLTSNEQLFDQSGEPVRDAYGFIARRLI